LRGRRSVPRRAFGCMGPRARAKGPRSTRSPVGPQCAIVAKQVARRPSRQRSPGPTFVEPRMSRANTIEWSSTPMRKRSPPLSSPTGGFKTPQPETFQAPKFSMVGLISPPLHQVAGSSVRLGPLKYAGPLGFPFQPTDILHGPPFGSNAVRANRPKNSWRIPSPPVPSKSDRVKFWPINEEISRRPVPPRWASSTSGPPFGVNPVRAFRLTKKPRGAASRNCAGTGKMGPRREQITRAGWLQGLFRAGWLDRLVPQSNY